jgi:hypothetical protein
MSPLRSISHRLVALAALLLPAASLDAQQCVAPGTVTGRAVRAAGGLEWGGEGSARGTTLALHGRRWFVLGEYTDRGWALGRRTYSGLPLPGFMERQHQVLGARAGFVRTLNDRTALCVSGGYAMGTGLGFELSGDPIIGGVGFDAHRRVRADIELIHELTVRGVRLLPAVNAGVLFVNESELQGDIMNIGTTGSLPITFTLGVPIGDALTIRPRYNAARRRNARGASYGIDAVVQLGRNRR